jgi:hypothetical protein
MKVKLIVQKQYANLTIADFWAMKLTNGCGADGDWRNFIIPQTIEGFPNVGCIFHDRDYADGMTAEDKRVADKHLQENMDRIGKAAAPWWNPFGWGMGCIEADIFFEAVDKFGRGPFMEGKPNVVMDGPGSHTQTLMFTEVVYEIKEAA